MLMTIVIAVMTIATVAAAAFLLAPRFTESKVVFDTRPDGPRNFGYRMGWLAIRTRDSERVIERLGLTDLIETNWDNGIGTIYDEHEAASRVYVTPPVNGWTFVIGLALPQPLGRSFVDKTTPLLLELGSYFIEVQYYLACPDYDCFAWARVVDGKLVRAYAINDEGVVWNKGKQSKEERTLGNKLFEVRGVKRSPNDAKGELVLYPTEQHILQLAGKWGLDPSELEKLDPPASTTLGIIGTAPSRWKVERLRRTA